MVIAFRPGMRSGAERHKAKWGAKPQIRDFTICNIHSLREAGRVQVP